MANATLAVLIHYAFSLPGPASSDGRIVGLPNWAAVTTYDLQGVAEYEVDRASLLAMLVPLLTERFSLKFHWENREVPVYFLVVGKSGPKIQPWHDGAPTTGMRKMTIDTLVHMLASSETTDHNAISDRTGLAGYFDLSALSKTRPGAAERSRTLMDDWLARLPDELGLELRREKGLGQFLCIDNVQKVPTDN